MAGSETPPLLDDLERRVAAAVERAVAELRQEMLERLAASHREAERLIGELETVRPDRFLDPEELASLLAPPPPPEPEVSPAAAAAPPDLERLLEAVRDIDGADSQDGILAALLDGACRFASRSAIFLTRADGISGWASRGFEAEVATAMASGYEEPPWDRLAALRGAVRLSASDCAPMASRLEVPLPEDGAFVPLVLRDRMAAVLYADRAEGNGGLDLPALQLLVLTAAQAIEVLPFRARGATATLWTSEDASGEPALQPWDASALTPPAESETAATGVAAVAEEPAEGPAAADAPYPETAEPEWEPEPDWARAAAPDLSETTAFDVTDIAAEEVWTLEEDAASVTAAPGLEGAEEETAALVPPAQPAVPPAAAPPVWEPAAPEPAVPGAEEPVSEESVPASEGTMPVSEGTMPVSEGTTPVSERPLPAWTAPEAPVDISEDDTVMVHRPAPPEEPAPPPAVEPTPPPPPAPPPRPGRAEVAPPPDLEGPGWAFSTRRIPTQAGEEGLHEEARRLARLLVSEIKLYNEEEVEEGRRKGDLHQRLKEDIERSRQMYEERVEERIRAGNDYFQQELVRILAGGDSTLLGM